MRFIWCVTIFSGCILLCSQFIHLYHLYKLERNSYIHYQNEFIKGGVHEFNMKSANLKKAGCLVGFDAKSNNLAYRIDDRKSTTGYMLKIISNGP